MANDSTLIAKLNALIADEPVFINKARVISKTGTPVPLDALLGEIDNTVLERTLVFAIDTALLHVAVAGRRLRGILELTGGPDTALKGQVLAQDDIIVQQRLHNFLAQLCEGAALVTVQSLPAGAFGSPSEAGISASSLMRLSQNASGTTTSLMSQFLSDNRARLTACLRARGTEIITTEGDTTALNHIWRDQAGPLQNGRKAIFAQDHDPSLIVMTPALHNGQTIAIAVMQGETAVMSCASDQTTNLLSSWRKTIR